MPSADTFTVPPIAAVLDRLLVGCTSIVDPFARNSARAHHRNDLNPSTAAEHHMEAAAFCALLAERGIIADAVLFDPPYSPRQIQELYQSIGKPPSREDTQNARLYKQVRTGLDRILRPGGIAISCGWNSCGFGPSYELIELLLVAHGGAHNDTIVTAERKLQGDLLATSPIPGKER